MPDESSTSETMATLSAMMNAGPDELARYYDQWSDSYDEDLARIGYVAPRVAAELLDEHGVDHDGPILDAGCGTGLTGLQLQKSGFDLVTGLDISGAELWSPLLHSEPSTYLPGHEDFGDEKTIVYDIYRVN